MKVRPDTLRRRILGPLVPAVAAFALLGGTAAAAPVLTTSRDAGWTGNADAAEGVSPVWRVMARAGGPRDHGQGEGGAKGGGNEPSAGNDFRAAFITGDGGNAHRDYRTAGHVDWAEGEPIAFELSWDEHAGVRLTLRPESQAASAAVALAWPAVATPGAAPRVSDLRLGVSARRGAAVSITDVALEVNRGGTFADLGGDFGVELSSVLSGRPERSSSWVRSDELLSSFTLRGRATASFTSRTRDRLRFEVDAYANPAARSPAVPAPSGASLLGLAALATARRRAARRAA